MGHTEDPGSADDRWPLGPLKRGVADSGFPPVTRGSSAGYVPLAIALVTFVTFTPSLWNDFVNYDDYSISGNPGYQGLGSRQLRWMFTALVAGHYMPLTWLTLALDHAVWGLNPMGYHLTNLLLHTASAALFYRVALRLLRRATALPDQALCVAAIGAVLFFALHPLRAESVAWASERRDVLSGFFFLSTILLYLEAQAADGRRRRWLLSVSVAAYVCALAAKSVVITLPLVLILLDVYPLRRPVARWFDPQGRAVWVEKIPYLLLSLAGAGVSYYVHRLVMPAVSYPWSTRLAVTLQSLWFYIIKTALPLALSPVYELPAEVDLLSPGFLSAAIAAVSVTVLLFMLRGAWPAGLAVWTYYGITLAPVSGLVFNGVRAADRYSYLSCLGWALLLGAALGTIVASRPLASQRPSWRRLVVGLAAVYLLGLATLTWGQVQIWKDGESLWRHAVRVMPDCFICQTNRGAWLTSNGAPLAGLTHYQRALALRPDLERARLNVAWAYAKLGMLPEAIEHFRHAIALAPTGAASRLGLIQAYLAAGQTDLARREYDMLRALNPVAASRVGGAFTPER